MLERTGEGCVLAEVRCPSADSLHSSDIEDASAAAAGARKDGWRRAWLSLTSRLV